MVVDLVAINMLPLSIVKSDELLALTRKVSPTYALPSRKKFSTKLLSKRAQAVRALALESSRQAPNHSLTLECDSWTSLAGVSVVAIILNRHTGESFVLDLADASGARHTSEYLAGIVLDSLRAREVPIKKINCLVTDEASNMKKARDLITKSLDPERHVLHYRCMAHVFNLITGSVCNHLSVKPHISALIEMIRKISANKFLLTELKKTANAPVKIVPKRWYSVSVE